jgi:2-C-methyl-D-erythritol 2,4-cyclodiphosphate synthase
MSLRIGQGWDVHALVPGRRLVLAGVEIPSERGLAGHSDADVLAHAVGDALLGAIGAGDLGRHFPSSDERWRDASGARLLGGVCELVAAAGFAIVNVDATLIAEQPRLAPFAAALRKGLAGQLALDESRVNVKLKSADGLGAIGRGEGIAAQAVALVETRSR